MSALDVSHTVGYSLYETLLLHPRWTLCPVQIRAHHHIDVCTDTVMTKRLQVYHVMI